MIEPADQLTDVAFCREVAANPKDDAVRLIYADWLEERGEPRAEFIRTQITLSRGNLQPADDHVFAERVAELYWKHHRFWNGQIYRHWKGTPLSGVERRAVGIRGWRYRCGFPEILDTDGEIFVRHADLVLGAAPFQEIILRQPRQQVREFLTQHVSVFVRVERIILPEIQNLEGIATELLERIRIGVHNSRSLVEGHSGSQASPRRGVFPPFRRSTVVPARAPIAEPAPLQVPPDSELVDLDVFPHMALPQMETPPVPQSLWQKCKAFWKGLRG